MEKLKYDFYKYWYMILIILLYLIFMQIFFGQICPIRIFLHTDCPGCGLTHATIYMLKGQFIEAFKANYTVFLWWALIVLFFIDRYIRKLKIKIIPTLFIIVCIITMLRYFINIIILYKK